MLSHFSRPAQISMITWLLTSLFPTFGSTHISQKWQLCYCIYMFYILKKVTQLTKEISCPHHIRVNKIESVGCFFMRDRKWKPQPQNMDTQWKWSHHCTTFKLVWWISPNITCVFLFSPFWPSVCGCRDSQRSLPPTLHVQVSSLDAVVVGKVQPFGKVFLQVGRHWLVSGPALQNTHTNTQTQSRRESWTEGAKREAHPSFRSEILNSHVG